MVRRYFRQLGLVEKIRRHVSTTVPGTDYGIVGMIMVVLTLLIVGGRRVWHVAYVANDPMVRRVTGADFGHRDYSFRHRDQPFRIVITRAAERGRAAAG